MTPRLGDRVQLHPACDEWMQGDRFGVVVGLSRTLPDTGAVSAVRVKLDRSSRIRAFHPDNILEVI